MGIFKPRAKGLADSLAKAAAEAFTTIREAHPEEEFYFFALYTTADGSYVCATAWSEEALARVVAEYRTSDSRRSVEGLTRSLRFSAPDSPYHALGEAAFSSFPSGRRLHDACFDALRCLDHDGYFGRGSARAGTIVNVVYGDMSDQQWLEHATLLNPTGAVEKALSFLHLHLPSGRVSAWGANAYQVNALSLSADRSMVAYSGSGGEVGVLRVPDRKALYEKVQRAEQWASVLSPDGAHLFLGNGDGVGILDVRSGKHRPFVRTGKPSSLALSPDGRRLAVSSWESPLGLFDTVSGEPSWTQPATKQATIAFSPCGTWLAVASSTAASGAWRASVSCYDATSGRERWTSPLGSGSTASLAWSPAGDELLVAASEWTYSPDMEVSGAASLAFISAANGGKLRDVPWPRGIDAVAIAPGRRRIALCVKEALVVLDQRGAELARGTGRQESLDRCAFVDDDTVLAVGRDVNYGPAILSLSL